MAAAAYQIITTTDATEQYELFSLAVEHWNDPDQFSDAQVAEVKALFGTVFSLDGKELKGLTLSDAVMLRAADECGLFYVAQVLPLEKGIRWVKVAVRNCCFEVTSPLPLDTFLMFMRAVPSKATHADSTKAEILSIICDNAEESAEPYTPELVIRVTGRKPDDPRPLLRETKTLRTMFDEAMKLGFEGNDSEIEEGCIYLDYVNTSKLDKGYAPQGFTASFTCEEDESRETVQSGVYMDDDYGHYQYRVNTWGDWDRMLNELMSP